MKSYSIWSVRTITSLCLHESLFSYNHGKKLWPKPIFRLILSWSTPFPLYQCCIPQKVGLDIRHHLYNNIDGGGKGRKGNVPKYTLESRFLATIFLPSFNHGKKLWPKPIFWTNFVMKHPLPPVSTLYPTKSWLRYQTSFVQQHWWWGKRKKGKRSKIHPGK